jgi:hypothetical protein
VCCALATALPAPIVLGIFKLWDQHAALLQPLPLVPSWQPTEEDGLAWLADNVASGLVDEDFPQALRVTCVAQYGTNRMLIVDEDNRELFARAEQFELPDESDEEEANGRLDLGKHTNLHSSAPRSLGFRYA